MHQAHTYSHVSVCVRQRVRDRGRDSDSETGRVMIKVFGVADIEIEA